MLITKVVPNCLFGFFSFFEKARTYVSILLQQNIIIKENKVALDYDDIHFRHSKPMIQHILFELSIPGWPLILESKKTGKYLGILELWEKSMNFGVLGKKQGIFV